jgi:hypothetical protein
VGMKRREEDGRILLGDNTDGVAIMLRSKIQCLLVSDFNRTPLFIHANI